MVSPRHRAISKGALLVVWVVLCLASASAAEPVRVVCIGDSITQGRGDHSAGGASWFSTDGWRYDFWKDSIDAGVPIKFVGSVTTGFESTPIYPEYKGQKFENRHEARWGWTTEGEYDKLKEVQSQWTADVALIYLGTNREPLTDAEKGSDPNAIARTTAAMRHLILLLRQNNPRMAIFIREIIGGDARMTGVNQNYAELARELSTPASPITIVPQTVGWQWNPKMPGSDTVDGCHPNKQGDEKLAAGFWKAAEAVIAADLAAQK